MAFKDTLKSIGKFVSESVEVIGEWVKEPLRRAEHQRNEEKANNDMHRQLRIRKEEYNLRIRRETEIMRMIAEIEEFKKDKELQRMTLVTEAMVRFQEDLTRLNVDAINSIGDMQLELRDKAYDLIEEKKKKCVNFCDESFEKAMDDLKRIEAEFKDNEVAKQILNKAVEAMLANIFDTARSFLFQIEEDLKGINKNIDLLMQSSQNFIEEHLNHIKTLKIDEVDLKYLNPPDED